METEDFQKYLKERYEDQINWYDKKSVWNQKMYRYFQWSVIILATITPVLVAIPSDKNRWLTVAIAALVAIGTSILKTFKYQENWINYRTTCETLRKEIHFYRADLGDYRDSEDREALFVERVESLISRENTMWLTTQRPKEGKKSPS
ncbi:MAG: DUF4231 domain-containing protein [Planctomycetota bacterium]|jgi:hypothetical protein